MKSKLKQPPTENQLLTEVESVDPKEECKHVWIPAGHRKNKDRIHNSGSGKYKAYKCEECGAFKKRYFS